MITFYELVLKTDFSNKQFILFRSPNASNWSALTLEEIERSILQKGCINENLGYFNSELPDPLATASKDLLRNEIFIINS